MMLPCTYKPKTGKETDSGGGPWEVRITSLFQICYSSQYLFRVPKKDAKRQMNKQIWSSKGRTDLDL